MIMTSNAIAAYRATEEHRHNLVYEQQQQQAINENIRHNKAYEAITQQGNFLHYQASIYGSNMAYKSAIYSADKHYAATKYSAERSYAAAKYSADKNAGTQKYIAGIQSGTQRYVANTHRNSNMEVAKMSNQTQRFINRQNISVQRESILNQFRMNAATNQTHIITSGIGAFSNMAGSAVRMIPLVK